MADTSIEWTDATWNPVAGCTVHLSRLHELLRDADGGPAGCDGREEISRADPQERQASGLDWQGQA